MTPNNPMTEGEALAVDDIAVELEHFANCPARVLLLAGKLRALTGHTAASGGEVVAWALFDPMGGKPEILTCKERPYSLDNWQPLYRHPPAAVPSDGGSDD